MIGTTALEELGYSELAIAAYQHEVAIDNRPRQLPLAHDYKGDSVVAKVFHTYAEAMEWATAATAHFQCGAEQPLAIPLRRRDGLAGELWLGVAAGIDLCDSDSRAAAAISIVPE